MQPQVYRLGTSADKPLAVGRSQPVESRCTGKRTALISLPFYACPPDKAESLQRIFSAAPGVGKETQISRVVRALMAHPEGVTRLDLEHHLDIGHAPRRVKDVVDELGHRVMATWVVQAGALGRAHRTKLYRLAAEGQTR